MEILYQVKPYINVDLRVLLSEMDYFGEKQHYFGDILEIYNYALWGFPGGSMVKNPLMQEKQEARVQILGPKDPLEEGMATHSSILA